MTTSPLVTPRPVLLRGLLCSALLLAAGQGFSAEPVAQRAPERPLTVEEEFAALANIRVISVSRTESTVGKSPAAVTVITAEDIRRSGVTSIPEALRLAPGLHVARQNGHQWAIASRGFNAVFSSKLLVMLDGRAVYWPISSGVLWEDLDTLLEDIERIEVIRGPAGSVWGANAVNGVINIITKHAKDTQGGLVSAGGGTEERGFGSIRYGGKLGENAHFRLFGKFFNRDDQTGQRVVGATESFDGWWQSRGGFRVDWNASPENLLTFHGELFNGEADELIRAATIGTVQGDARKAGGFLQARWAHTLSAESDWVLQAYYDRVEDEVIGAYASGVHTWDLDFQHRFQLGDRQEILWGLEYRWVQDDTRSMGITSFVPAARTYPLYSGFVQDTITLVEDRLKLTLGSKLELNDDTGIEIQPSARLAWMPHERHTVWAAVSRAVRTPSRFETGRRQQTNPGTVTVNNPGFRSEELLAYELGYRALLHRRFNVDIATFYNEYDRLRTFEASPGVQTPDNKMKGETYGVEVAANWQPTDWWRLQANYSFLQIQLHLVGSTGMGFTAEGESPHQQFGLRSLMDLPGHWALDCGLRFVDTLPVRRFLHAYVVGDVRIGWRPNKHWELSIVGQNLFNSHHPEFSSTIFSTTEVQPSVYGKVTWRF